MDGEDEVLHEEAPRAREENPHADRDERDREQEHALLLLAESVVEPNGVRRLRLVRLRQVLADERGPGQLPVAVAVDVILVTVAQQPRVRLNEEEDEVEKDEERKGLRVTAAAAVHEFTRQLAGAANQRDQRAQHLAVRSEEHTSEIP